MAIPENLEEWERKVGKLILAFGCLEHAMIGLYKIFLPKRDYYEDSFNDHFDKLIGAIKQRQKSKKAIDALIELKQIADTRHLLAHNSLYFNLYENKKTGQIVFETSITDKLRKTRITLEQLSTEASLAQELVGTIYAEFQAELWEIQTQEDSESYVLE